MTIRRATPEDESVLHELWDEFELEVPEPEGFIGETWEEEWRDTQRDIADGAVYVAEDDEGPVGVARASAPERGRSHLHLIHVRPRARRTGVAKALVRECVRDVKEKGATLVSLDVLTTNTAARSVWTHLGFAEVALFMASPVDGLEQRLEERRELESRAAIYVQTDDRVSIDRALAQFIPRLDEPEVREAPTGWIRIVDRLTTDDRSAQSALAHELSERLGAVTLALAMEQEAVVRFRLYERGLMVDEYVSVPTYYGELPKGDELALAANPTLVARLTGADREEVRRVARTASLPAELPPAPELYRQIALLMGLEP